MIHDWHERVVSGGGGWPGSLCRAALTAAECAYGWIIARRNARYDARPGLARRVGAPVVSVGNITTGGAGKTPLVIDLLGRLQAANRRPAVVSRGYRADAAGMADELALIRQTVPAAVCIADPDRVRGAESAIRDHHADVVVLDDGYQHRRLARDLNILVVDALRPFGLDRLLPRGFLREPLSNLRRADVIVLTRTDQVAPPQLQAVCDRLSALVPGVPQLRTVHRPTAVRPLVNAAGERSPSPGDRVFLAAGIGNFASFVRTSGELGWQIVRQLRFNDHHRYVAGDVVRICAAARAANAGFVIVTEKDAVKLERLHAAWTLPVGVLGVRIDFCGEDGTIMDELLRRVVQARR